MKKSLILAAALVLVATSAMATSIVGSAHDLNAVILGASGTNDSAEVCVFCHTPHAALPNNNAPLWNRNLGTTTFTYYNSATLSDFSKDNIPASLISNAIASSDAVLCMTCHDGASITDGLVNPPNAGVPTWGAYTMGTNANIGGGTGNDLSNDHPIGMVYDDVQGGATDAGGFVASAGGLTVGALNLYNGRMWCSSCHDVHNNDYAPFLATSNAASALCITCHIK